MNETNTKTWHDINTWFQEEFYFKVRKTINLSLAFRKTVSERLEGILLKSLTQRIPASFRSLFDYLTHSSYAFL